MTEAIDLARDISMSFPEDIWALNPIERYLRCRTAPEFATLDDSRYFIRAILPVPLIDDHDEFIWGVWCEVSREDHDHYLEAYALGTLGELGPIVGKLANDLPVYDDSLGVSVEMTPSALERPRVKVVGPGLLKMEQEAGIDRERHEEIDRILFGDEKEAEEEANS